MIATYWSLDADTLIKLYSKLNKVLDKAVLVSKQRLSDIGEDCDSVFFTVEIPSYKVIYLTKDGEPIKHSDMSEVEVAEAVSVGACVEIPIADSNNVIKNNVTVYSGICKGKLLKSAYVNLSDAINELGVFFSNITGIKVELSELDNIDSTPIEKLDMSKINVLLDIARTYAISNGIEDILKASIDDTVVEKVVASVNANYVYSVLK